MSDHLARARVGFSDGERYDRARPDYPAGAVDALCRHCGIGPGTPTLDLAAGTGKLTRHLVTQGAVVTAVDPTPGMRDALRAALPGIWVEDGSAEALPMANRTFAAVTVAQAFHWFDAPRAIREIHRVLVPGGALGMVWNVMDRDVEWVDRLQTLIQTWRGENPWYSGHTWREAFRDSHLFAPVRHEAVRNAQVVDLEGLRQRVSSVSFIAAATPERQAEMLDAAAELVMGLGLDPARIEIPYRTDVFWTRSSDGS